MKVKLNKKGFAISTMIYSIFLMFLILVASLLALLSYRKTIFDAHKKAIYEEANNLPSVIVKNVSISYDERLNYSLTDDISLCTGCSIISVTLDDYEIEKDKEGNLKGEFPDKNNHTIDAARYGCEQDIIQSKGRAGKNRARYEN